MFCAGVDVKEHSGGDAAAHRKKRSDRLYELLFTALDFSQAAGADALIVGREPDRATESHGQSQDQISADKPG